MVGRRNAPSILFGRGAGRAIKSAHAHRLEEIEALVVGLENRDVWRLTAEDTRTSLGVLSARFHSESGEIIAHEPWRGANGGGTWLSAQGSPGL